jgi:hypothetical protein
MCCIDGLRQTFGPSSSQTTNDRFAPEAAVWLFPADRKTHFWIQSAVKPRAMNLQPNPAKASGKMAFVRAVIFAGGVASFLAG